MPYIESTKRKNWRRYGSHVSRYLRFIFLHNLKTILRVYPQLRGGMNIHFMYIMTTKECFMRHLYYPLQPSRVFFLISLCSNSFFAVGFLGVIGYYQLLVVSSILFVAKDFS